jgi:hypothetical protein|tara:strand:- start:3831 stop:4103 length:273 start_codon:yes stop_codon:yes gene_type:complete
MNKIQFTKALSAMTDSLTKTDVEDAWDTYQDLIEQLSEPEGIAGDQMAQLTEMNTKERLYWRTCLSEEGVELTPSQVDDYLMIVELALEA